MIIAFLTADMITKFFPQNKKQNGVTLLLAILILAAITAIAFSVAAIILVEIRSSGDVTRTEPALYAAQAVTEEAFFKYARNVNDSLFDVATGDTSSDTTGCAPASTNMCNGSGSTTFNGVSLNSPAPAARQFDPAPRLDAISPNSTTHYLFIDPNNPNDFSTQVYSSITVTALNSVSGVSAVFTKCCDASGNSIAVRTDTLTVNTPDTCSSGCITDTKQYDLGIQNTSATTTLLVKLDAIKTTAVSGQTHLIPLLNHTIDITATYLGLTRKYFVSIPSGASASQ